ncbi:MAG: hypothetical protein WCB02_36265, partial [Bradyrhizobium sp.]
MVDDRLDDPEAPSDAGRPKRSPPTIELEAVSSETRAGIADETAETRAAAEPAAEAAPEPAAEREPAMAASAAPEAKSRSTPRSTSPWLIAPLSGAVAAILVIAAGWALGFAPVQPAPAVPASNTAAVDDLTGRVAGLEQQVGKLADSASSPRIDALDKSVAALRDDVGNLRAQSDKLAAAVTDIKSAPHDAAGAVDLSG